MRRFIAALALVLFTSPTFAQIATVVDGDTIKLDGTTYRLWGIDAPEAKQACADGWPAGQEAAKALRALLSGPVTCESRGLDRYGRTIGLCQSAGADLGRSMVHTGMAWAFIRYSRDYIDDERRAKEARLGVHVHGCLPAWEWRAIAK